MPENHTTLPECPRVINKAGGTVTYQQLYNAVLNGKVDGQKVGNRWTLTDPQLVDAIRYFGGVA